MARGIGAVLVAATLFFGARRAEGFIDSPERGAVAEVAATLPVISLKPDSALVTLPTPAALRHFSGTNVRRS